MEFKFSVIDDISGLTIGYSEALTGLLGEIHNEDGYSFHKVSLLKFCFCDDFKEYLKKRKESLNRLVYICVIDKEMKPLAKFSFMIFDETYYHKTGFPECPIQLELKGSLEDIASEYEIQLWEKWRISLPMHKNQWSNLTEEGRRAWLQIVKRYNYCTIPKYEEKVGGTYYLDGTYITDYPSFFCALGDAMNGPGSYYGFDLGSCMDCISGGFGPRMSFTLVWDKSKIAEQSLDRDAWIREINYRSEIDSKLLEQPEFREIGDKPLFQAIIDMFTSIGIKIIFKP